MKQLSNELKAEIAGVAASSPQQGCSDSGSSSEDYCQKPELKFNSYPWLNSSKIE